MSGGGFGLLILVLYIPTCIALHLLIEWIMK
jgi:hypothetical protein